MGQDMAVKPCLMQRAPVHLAAGPCGTLTELFMGPHLRKESAVVSILQVREGGIPKVKFLKRITNVNILIKIAENHESFLQSRFKSRLAFFVVQAVFVWLFALVLFWFFFPVISKIARLFSCHSYLRCFPFCFAILFNLAGSSHSAIGICCCKEGVACFCLCLALSLPFVAHFAPISHMRIQEILKLSTDQYRLFLQICQQFFSAVMITLHLLLI